MQLTDNHEMKTCGKQNSKVLPAIVFFRLVRLWFRDQFAPKASFQTHKLTLLKKSPVDNNRLHSFRLSTVSYSALALSAGRGCLSVDGGLFVCMCKSSLSSSLSSLVKHWLDLVSCACTLTLWYVHNIFHNWMRFLTGQFFIRHFDNNNNRSIQTSLLHSPLPLELACRRSCHATQTWSLWWHISFVCALFIINWLMKNNLDSRAIHDHV